MDRQRDHYLDFLKITASVIIVFHHYQLLTGTVFTHMINFGGGRIYFGYVVELFFMISGICMFHHIGKIGNGEPFGKFFLKKYLRFIPMLLLTSVIFWLAALLYRYLTGETWHGVDISFSDLVIAALGLQNGLCFGNRNVNDVTWYISVLLLMYVLFYFEVYLAKRLKVSAYILFGITVIAGITLLTAGTDLPFLNGFTARGMYSFFWGLCIAKLFEYHKACIRDTVISGLIILAVAFLTIFRYSFMEDSLNLILTFIFYPALLVFFRTDFFGSIFANPVNKCLAAVSYDVFLWHYPLVIVMYDLISLSGVKVNVQSGLVMILFTAVCFGISFASHYLYDGKMQKYLHKMMSWSKEKSLF